MLAILESVIVPDYTNLRWQLDWLGGAEARLEFAYPGRVSLMAGNPLTFGDLTLPLLFSILVGFLAISWPNKILRIAVFGLGSFAVVILTLNRSSIIVWGVLFAIFVLYVFLQLNWRKRFVMISGLIVTLMVASAMIIPRVQDQKFMQRFSNIGDSLGAVYAGEITEETVSDRSLLIRFDMYQAAFRAIQEQPLLGYGVPEMMPTIEARTQTETAKKYVSETGMTAHSLILNSWLSSGIFGLLAIIIITGAPVIYWIADAPTRRNLDLGYLAGIISAGIFVAGLTNNVYFDDAKNTAFLSYIFLYFILASQMRLPKV